MNNIFLDRESLGCTVLINVVPDFYGSDKNRHEEPVGYKYEVMLPTHRYDKLAVKIPGPQLLEAPVSGHEPMVEFADLRVKPYVDHSGRLAFTASATGIKVVGSGTAADGKNQAKG